MNRILLIAIIIIFTAVSAILVQAPGAGAVGAPSDNVTVPGFNGDDLTQDVIRPLVNYVRVSPSVQADKSEPRAIPALAGAAEQDEAVITDMENWYLDIDINMDGWIYIYEYYPKDAGVRGRWIAYKWQLPQDGIWRFGPFVARDDEPEGEHVYRIWFYGDGKWADYNSAGLQSYLVYWTYSRDVSTGETVDVAPPPPPPPAEQFFGNLCRFIAQHAVWFIGCLILLILGAAGFFGYKLLYQRRKIMEPGEAIETVETDESKETPTSSLRARILLPNDTVIKLGGNGMIIGRDDLARTLKLDELVLVSRRHFQVKSHDGQFYIEDMDSANGTSLNGADISDSGPVELSNDDVIGVAGVADLKFTVL